MRKVVEKEVPCQLEPATEWDFSVYKGRMHTISELQNALMNAGIVDFVCKVIQQKDFTQEAIDEAVMLGVLMLLGGNRKVQKRFFQLISDDEDNKFLLNVKRNVEFKYCLFAASTS